MNSATRPSDVNDLEEHLQQNMKLRCELGAEVAKALAKHKVQMAQGVLEKSERLQETLRAQRQASK